MNKGSGAKMRRSSPIASVVAVLACVVVLAGSCQTTRHAGSSVQPPSPTTRPVVSGKPLIDFGKGAGGFPLDVDQLPATREALVEALTQGYHVRVETAADVTP